MTGHHTQIKSFGQLKALVANGKVTSAFINEGEPNPTIFRLKPTGALINCPAIVHLDQSLILFT